MSDMRLKWKNIEKNVLMLISVIIIKVLFIKYM